MTDDAREMVGVDYIDDYLDVPPVLRGLRAVVDEIVRLRDESETRRRCLLNAESLINALRLTDAEREAVAYFAVIDGPQFLPAANAAATTLRVLLARLGATNETDGYVE